MIAKDFNKKIILVRIYSKSLLCLDFYHEQYEEDIMTCKSLVEEKSGEERNDDGREFYDNLGDVGAYNLDNMLEPRLSIGLLAN